MFEYTQPDWYWSDLDLANDKNAEGSAPELAKDKNAEGNVAHSSSTNSDKTRTLNV